jgi:hypothetical protein
MSQEPHAAEELAVKPAAAAAVAPILNHALML